MADEETTNTETPGEMSDDEAILKIAQAMKDNVPSQDDKQNVHTFLREVAYANEIDTVAKVGNLRDDKEINELGIPTWNVRGALEMARISEKIMDNEFFKEYFQASAKETLITSLSREGFLVRQASTQTKAVADITKRKKVNKGMFGHKTEEIQGGDPYSGNS